MAQIKINLESDDLETIKNKIRQADNDNVSISINDGSAETIVDIDALRKGLEETGYDLDKYVDTELPKHFSSEKQDATQDFNDLMGDGGGDVWASDDVEYGDLPYDIAMRAKELIAELNEMLDENGHPRDVSDFLLEYESVVSELSGMEGEVRDDWWLDHIEANIDLKDYTIEALQKLPAGGFTKNVNLESSWDSTLIAKFYNPESLAGLEGHVVSSFSAVNNVQPSVSRDFDVSLDAKNNSVYEGAKPS